jgi:hypothetical protein
MNELLDLHPQHWQLAILPHGYRQRLLAAAAQIAQRSPLIVLDCGRQFDASIVARAARGRPEIIDRIQVQRAFICYEAVKLLESLPAEKTPVLILDFLSTFYDENVKIHTRRFLLEGSLKHFQRLSQGAGLAVTVHAPPAGDDSLALFQRLRACAPQVFVEAAPVLDSKQLRLF